MFTAEEKPLLTVLPAAGYEISRWVYGRRVARNGHVIWEKNYYSVPFTHIGTTVDLGCTKVLGQLSLREDQEYGIGIEAEVQSAVQG